MKNIKLIIDMIELYIAFFGASEEEVREMRFSIANTLLKTNWESQKDALHKS